MPVNTISTEIFINHLRDTLSNQDNKICFILGAGASVESGIETGAMLSRKWYDELPLYHSPERIAEWKAKETFDENNISAFYSKLFRLRYEGHRDDGIHFITSIIEKGNPGFGYTILSQVLCKRHNVVITTNFDTLTEESLFVFTNKRALVCNHEYLAHLVKPSSTRPLIIKLHRGLYMDPLNDEEETAEIKPQWNKALSDILRNYIPIVIGYGGNDGSLMSYLRGIESCQRMYWCLYSDMLPRSDIRDVVEHHHGSFVTIGGFNRLMFRFIDLFGVSKIHLALGQLAYERSEKLSLEFEEAGKDINLKGTEEEKRELDKVAKDFDTSDWLQWELKAQTINEPDKKLKIYLEALSTLPESYKLLINCGFWLNKWGRYEEAIPYFLKAIEIKPDHYMHWHNLGISYSNKGDTDNALIAFQKSVEIQPDQYEIWNNISIIYGKKGEYDNAINASLKAVEFKSDFHQAWNNLGLAYFYKGEYNYALTAFRKVSEIQPDQDTVWKFLGIIYNNRGEYDNAINAYRKAVEINPNLYEAWFNMGNIYEIRGEYDNAIHSFQKATEIDPLLPSAWNNMGNVYNKKIEYDSAIRSLLKAVEINPDFYQALTNLGFSYLSKGEHNNALTAFRKTIEIYSDQDMVWNNLGII